LLFFIVGVLVGVPLFFFGWDAVAAGIGATIVDSSSMEDSSSSSRTSSYSPTLRPRRRRLWSNLSSPVAATALAVVRRLSIELLALLLLFALVLLLFLLFLVVG
jgi:hypothetical protein